MKRCFFILLAWTYCVSCNQLFNVDFCDSMGKNDPYYAKYYAACMESKETYGMAAEPNHITVLYDFFKKQYQENNLSVIKSTGILQIPHVTHMVWLGNKFPNCYLQYRTSWMQYNPKWAHVLWVDNPVNYSLGIVVDSIDHLAQDLSAGKYDGKYVIVDIKNLKFKNQKAINEATCFAEKADIMRLEIIYNFGGLYIDADFECCRSFDILNDSYAFYVGIQPLDFPLLTVANGLFGASRYHPILKKAIDSINVMREDDPNCSWKGIVTGTGGILLTRIFWQMACQEQVGRVIALPATYFYPIALNQKYYSVKQKKALKKDETFAMHHWAGAWSGKA